MDEVGEICTRTIEADNRGCYEEFFWNLVLDSIECHLLWHETVTPKMHSTQNYFEKSVLYYLPTDIDVTPDVDEQEMETSQMPGLDQLNQQESDRSENQSRVQNGMLFFTITLLLGHRLVMMTSDLNR